MGPEGEMLEERHKFASKRAVDLWSSLHVLIESPHRMARPSGAVTMQTKENIGQSQCARPLSTEHSVHIESLSTECTDALQCITRVRR